ncbi:DUF2510 domain-containing protein [Microbacterium sp. NPDC019599]|uniref:DUF2510 domain-containing protein n=1 Tax=Microbacterium sp. NPDC019599 TaxID=3154690 RepID=UPI0033C47EF2
MSTTESKAAPGWYPDETGQARWWDGTQWTEKTANAPATVAGENLVGEAEKSQPKKSWYKRKAVVIPAGALVGILAISGIANAAGGGDDTTDTASTSQVAEAAAEEPAAEQAPAEEEPAAEIGTRENPAAIGSTIEGDDWTVVINSVTLGATDQVLAANQFNEAPDAGTEYIIINYTATYTGDDPEGQMPAFVTLEYVTAGGVTVDGLDKLVVAPDAIDSMSTLYTGASATGNSAIQVPTPADGVIAVNAGMLADTIFVAIK